MSTNKNVFDLLREHKILLTVIGIIIFLIELEIFAMAAMKSGRKSWLQVLDTKGNVIHEANGKNLSDFNKYYFEKAFGPLEQYNVKLVTKEYPFPFRAWFAAAVGVPVCIILLFAFVVQAYISLFYGEKYKHDKNDSLNTEYDTQFEKILKSISHLNIFTIGFLVFLAIFSYWVIPNLITYLGKVGIETLIKYKWAFISIAAAFGGFTIWVVYLKYNLAKKTMENHMEVEKYRLQLEYEKKNTLPLLLEHGNGAKNGSTSISWNNKKDNLEEQNNETQIGTEAQK